MTDRINILIVDDRPENLLTLETLLEDPGLNILKALSGSEALEKVLENEIALVLLDVMMPDMDGYETAELMRSNRRSRNIPIIFVTANNREEDHIFKGYDAGAVDYLTKPIDPHVLQSKVGIFMELYCQKLELEEKTRELNAKVVELEELQQQLEDKNRQLETISNIDALTGIYNRRYFNEIIEVEWNRGVRQKHVISMLMIDIDFFKPFNDHYGHSSGDTALQIVADSISSPLKRKVDIIARYGGEEFAAVLPETDREGAWQLAREMLESVRNKKIPHKKSEISDFLTVSIGIFTILPSADKSYIDLINGADKALYQAKNSGRNQMYVLTEE